MDFSTLIGPFDRFPRLLDLWPQVTRNLTVEMEPPTVLPVPEEPDGTTLRVAMVRHRPGAAERVVAQLRVGLRAYDFSDIVVEQGYFYEPASAEPVAPLPFKASQWTVEWEPATDAHRHPITVTLTDNVYGSAWTRDWPSPARVVLIDTGDAGAAHQTGFELHKIIKNEPPGDTHGHGTSVGALIRAVSPSVDLHSYRVARAKDKYVESALLINALSVATRSPGKFDIVCVPQRAVLSETAKGSADGIEITLMDCAASGSRMPVIVCAAGNRGPSEPMAYPATVPGVVVAVGLDEAGRPAAYNCPTPPEGSPHTVDAFGGTEDNPVCYLIRDGRRRRQYGSSYAAAIVAASLSIRAAAPEREILRW